MPSLPLCELFPDGRKSQSLSRELQQENGQGESRKAGRVSRKKGRVSRKTTGRVRAGKQPAE